ALAMYEEDAVYVESDGTTSRGHVEIRETLAELIAMRPTLDCYEIDVVENGDMAVLRARWAFSGTRGDGATYESRGRSIEVVRRQADGSWRFTIDLPNGAT
ncbi:MAG TPA: DUF4440 domain-containing protein, partial [Thermomicrobiales bacterium]|nr:DUF4440 domain-containing protein [Thermomicrobiales bacterium]